MVVLRNSVLIGCTPEEAFDHLSDLRAELEWNPKCQVMEKITEGRRCSEPDARSPSCWP
ncbi:hypothetical protein C8D87_108126 [Lentzea atacamensis]|uniref:Uncharacterized protein n=1 Tax=Lentzea atacamensis TaxID=531938 RepID=A0ABX9E3P1_9PSEU|nr:hypothetical protein [Lentzea atacamensis]RAS62306.1 hypothetical protein C8D87_108126 [Lentzea atacamensis]